MPFAAFLDPALAELGSRVDFARCGRSKEPSGQGGEWDAARSAAPAPALPCLSSNNSTEKPSKLTPYQRKNAHSINENIAFAVEKFGLGKIGFLTLTFPKDLTMAEANRRLNSLATHFLNKRFVCWVCVREFTKGGRPHFHLVVVCKEEIREGFNFVNYTEMNWMGSSPRRRHKFLREIKALSRALDPSPELRSVWNDLRAVLPLYKFGRHELIPIRKNGAALARYVGGYIRKSMDFRPVEAKGARLITYSKSFPRKIVGHAWGFHTPAKAIWRKKVARFSELHRIQDLGQMKFRFGPRWAWWFRDVIESLNILPGLSIEEVRVYFDSGVDAVRFQSALETGATLQGMHLYEPRLPEVSGVVDLQPPRRLRHVFDFHLSSWRMSPDEIAERSASDRRRMADLRASGRVYFTEESFEAAKVRLLSIPSLSAAAVRSANYFRTRFSHLTPSLS